MKVWLVVSEPTPEERADWRLTGAQVRSLWVSEAQANAERDTWARRCPAWVRPMLLLGRLTAGGSCGACGREKPRHGHPVREYGPPSLLPGSPAPSRASGTPLLDTDRTPRRDG